MSPVSETVRLAEDPRLAEFRISFSEGETLFREGEASRDLYILSSGALDISKGGKRIFHLDTPGGLFGEISFFQEKNRTATALAIQNGEALRIPGDKLSELLEKVPGLALAIIRTLADRLSLTTTGLYGFQQFSDKLPEAVLFLDPSGHVSSWNASAERLCGRPWEEMGGEEAGKLLVPLDDQLPPWKDPGSAGQEREALFRVDNPKFGQRKLLVRARSLADEIGGSSGWLLICRDVTEEHEFRKRYRRLKIALALAPLILIVALAAWAAWKPWAGGNGNSLTPDQAALSRVIAKDLRELAWIVGKKLSGEHPESVSIALEEFLQSRQNSKIPYVGALFLDEDKRVAAGAGQGKETKRQGMDYSNIRFSKPKKSDHRILVSYRVDEENPRGRKELAVALPLLPGKPAPGWVLLHLDPEGLEEIYDANEETLLRFQIPFSVKAKP